MQPHVTTDWGTVYKLRLRLFPNFVVNSLFPQNNPIPFQVILFLLHMFMTESTNFYWSLSHSTTLTLLSLLICSTISILYTNWCLIPFIQLQYLQWVQSLDALRPHWVGTNEFNFWPLAPNFCLSNLYSRVNRLVWLQILCLYNQLFLSLSPILSFHSLTHLFIYPLPKESMPSVICPIL